MFSWIRKHFYINKDQRAHEKPSSTPILNSIAISDVTDTEWIRIIPIGYFPNHPNGEHEITAEHIRQMEANFKANSKDVLFDYDHGSVFKSDSRAAGWSEDVEAREDGLYAKFPAFTASAQKSIDDREYRYFSPVYFLNTTDKQGRGIGATIHSVALTNTPYMDQEIDHIGNSANHPGKEEPKNTNDNRTDMKLSKENLEKLGLKEDATEDQINQAISNSAVAPKTEGTEPVVEEKEKETAGSEANAGGTQATGEEDDRIAKLEARLAKREQQDLAEKAELLVNTAVKECKILPRDKQAYMNSANADYTKTKEMLDGIKVNSVSPAGMKVNSDVGEGGDDTTDRRKAFRDYCKTKLATA